MENLIENVVEWVTGDTEVTITLSQKKFITKVKRLAEKFPDEVKIVHINKDGSILCRLPLRAIKISLSPKRELTEEQRQQRIENLQKYRELNQEVDEDDWDDEE